MIDVKQRDCYTASLSLLHLFRQVYTSFRLNRNKRLPSIYLAHLSQRWPHRCKELCECTCTRTSSSACRTLIEGLLPRGYRGHLQFKWRLLYSSTVRPRDSRAVIQFLERKRERGKDEEREKARRSRSTERGRGKRKRVIKTERILGRGVNSSTGNCRVPRGCSVFRFETPAHRIKYVPV